MGANGETGHETRGVSVISGRSINLAAGGFVRVDRDREEAHGKLVFLPGAGRGFHAAAIAQIAKCFGDVFEAQHLDEIERNIGDLNVLRAHLDANR